MLKAIYPYTGFFPLKFLHGSGWSFYTSAAVPHASKLKVEVFKLKRRPEKNFGITADIPGTIVPVGYVASHLNSINFEPHRETVKRGGIFWVRIHGGGLRVGYLVELYCPQSSQPQDRLSSCEAPAFPSSMSLVFGRRIS